MDFTTQLITDSPESPDVLRLRKMVGESAASSTWTADDLEAVLARHTFADAGDAEATPDFHAAAAEIWETKAAAVAAEFDFAADGGQFMRSQQHKNMLTLASFHRSRRRPRRIPVEYGAKASAEIASGVDSWVGNLPESD